MEEHILEAKHGHFDKHEAYHATFLTRHRSERNNAIDEEESFEYRRLLRKTRWSFAIVASFGSLISIRCDLTSQFPFLQMKEGMYRKATKNAYFVWIYLISSLDKTQSQQKLISQRDSRASVFFEMFLL